MAGSKALNRYEWGAYTTYFNGEKSQVRAWCESLLERDYLLWLEFEDAVVSYMTQPVSIQFRTLRGARRYTPDVLVKWADGEYEFVEVKHQNALDAETRASLARAGEALRATFGAGLRLVTNAAIRDGHSHENRALLYGYRRSFVREDLAHAVEERFCSGQTFGDLRALVASLEAPDSHAFAMVAQGWFDLDLRGPLCAATPLYTAASECAEVA